MKGVYELHATLSHSQFYNMVFMSSRFVELNMSPARVTSLQFSRRTTRTRRGDACTDRIMIPAWSKVSQDRRLQTSCEGEIVWACRESNRGGVRYAEKIDMITSSPGWHRG